MARWLDAVWEHLDVTMVPRADRLSGPCRTYGPDGVTARPLRMSGEANHAATVAERAVRELDMGRGARELEGLARFLLRSEAIASSLIEGIAPSPQQVALLSQPFRSCAATPLSFDLGGLEQGPQKSLDHGRP
jgi:hypothetical protein